MDEGQVWIILMLVGYFLPAFVAKFRSHNNTLAIGMLNLFLGWTFVGWVVALVWACTDNIGPRKSLHDALWRKG